MKVKELIEVLKILPQDLDVVVSETYLDSDFGIIIESSDPKDPLKDMLVLWSMTETVNIKENTYEK